MSERVERAVHGGDLEAIARVHGVREGALLDFSANVAPAGPPPSLLRALREAAADDAHLAHYPEPTYRALREVLGRAHALDPATIVVGNGAAALLDAAIAALGVRRALVPTPAFSEYRRALASRGAAFVAAPLDRTRDFAFDTARLHERARSEAVDAVILNTPHNPSGASLPGAEARAFVAELSAESRATIVDEAFVDYVEDDSIATLAPDLPAVVVVRSLTKFFAVPALRVGFAVTHPDVAERMRAHVPSWNVTTIAARALAAALDDGAYAERTRDENARAREALRRALASIGLRALPSVANYLLVELPEAYPSTRATRRLVERHGIVVRDCASYDDLGDGRFVRVAVRGAADDARLVAALRDVLTEELRCVPKPA